MGFPAKSSGAAADRLASLSTTLRAMRARMCSAQKPQLHLQPPPCQWVTNDPPARAHEQRPQAPLPVGRGDWTSLQEDVALISLGNPTTIHGLRRLTAPCALPPPSR
jgi:hypothetical protein